MYIKYVIVIIITYFVVLFNSFRLIVSDLAYIFNKIHQKITVMQQILIKKQKTKMKT